MDKLNKITTTYKYDDDYMIDIVRAGDLLEAWIYHTEYGVKSLMFGRDTISYDDFLEMVEANAEDYIETYRRFHMREGNKCLTI